MDVMNIALIMDDNYLNYAKVMLHTLFYHHIHRRIIVYIFYTKLENKTKDIIYQIAFKYKQSIEFIQIAEHMTQNFPQRNPWPKTIWNSVLIPYYLPQNVRRVLYLDVDIVVNQALDSLYDIDMEDCCMVATQDMWVSKYRKGHGYRLRIFDNNFQYFNFGVNLMDILQIRELFPQDISQIEKFCRDNHERMDFLDQDFYNIFCYGKVKYVSSFEFDFVRDIQKPPVYSLKKIEHDVRVIHYAGTKPMRLEEIDKYGIIFWKYARKFKVDKEIYKNMKEDYIQKMGQRHFYKLIYETILRNIKQKHTSKDIQQCQKMTQYYYLMNKCTEFLLKGKKISTYMDMHGYESITLYGVTEVTKRFIDMALVEGYKINYVIDKAQKGDYKGIPYVNKIQRQDVSDVIVIAAEYWQDEIEKELKKNTDKEISCISQVIYEVG